MKIKRYIGDGYFLVEMREEEAREAMKRLENNSEPEAADLRDRIADHLLAEWERGPWRKRRKPST